MKLTNWMKELPAYKVVNEIVEKVLDNDVFIITGDTGSGKSVIIPKFLSELGKTVVSQPRVVNSITLAKTNECGYIAGGKKHNTKNKLVYCSAATLANMLSNDNIPEIGIIDEFHERSSYMDFIVDYMVNKKIDMKLVIMSATIDTEQVKNLFDDLSVGEQHIEGRTFPIEDIKISQNEINEIAIKEMEDNGKTVIIFESGKRQINDRVETLSKLTDLPVFHVYRGIDNIDKLLATDEPKIIVATDIIETGVTIGGDIVVIDTMYHNVVKTINGIVSLKREKVSIFNALQRRGRGGRTSEGKYYHVFNLEDLSKSGSSEIETGDLPTYYMYYLLRGLNMENIKTINNISSYDFILAKRKLEVLGFLDKDGNPTYESKRFHSYGDTVGIAKAFMEAEKEDLTNNLSIMLSCTDFRLDANPIKKSDDWGQVISNYEFIKNEFARIDKLNENLKKQNKKKGKKQYTQPVKYKIDFEFDKLRWKELKRNLYRHINKGFLDKNYVYDWEKHQDTLDLLGYIYNISSGSSSVYTSETAVTGRQSVFNSVSHGTLYVNVGFNYKGTTFNTSIAKLSPKFVNKLISTLSDVNERVRLINVDIEKDEITIEKRFNIFLEDVVESYKLPVSETPDELKDNVNNLIANEVFKNSNLYGLKQKIEVDEYYCQIAEKPIGKNIDNKDIICYIYPNIKWGENVLVTTLSRSEAEEGLERYSKLAKPYIESTYEERELYKTIEYYTVSREELNQHSMDFYKVIEVQCWSNGDNKHVEKTYELPILNVGYKIYYNKMEAIKVLGKKRINFLKKQRKVLKWLLSLDIDPKHILDLSKGKSIPTNETSVKHSTFKKYTVYTETSGNGICIECLGNLNNKSLVVEYDSYYEEYNLRVVNEFIEPTKDDGGFNTLGNLFGDRW